MFAAFACHWGSFHMPAEVEASVELHERKSHVRTLGMWIQIQIDNKQRTGLGYVVCFLWFCVLAYI